MLGTHSRRIAKGATTNEHDRSQTISPGHSGRPGRGGCLPGRRTGTGKDPRSVSRPCLDRAGQAVAGGLKQAGRVTHVATGQGRVDRVAGNRRIQRGPDGKVLAMRGSSCTDAKLIALPEGLIDPWLKTVAFFDRDTKIAACHYYATHPMSYYGDGRVSSDFAGLARKQRQQDEPGCLHVYFTGCAGNIAAGKYNDGSKGMRPVLTRRVYEGIVESEKGLRPEPVGTVSWRTHAILPPPRAGIGAEQLERAGGNKNNAAGG